MLSAHRRRWKTMEADNERRAQLGFSVIAPQNTGTASRSFRRTSHMLRNDFAVANTLRHE